MVGKIVGTGSMAPGQSWDNYRLSDMVDTDDGWIRERTGIVRRHVATAEDSVASLAAGAARAALENAGMDAGEIELILVATVSAESLVPCTACRVQSLIGAGAATCFDLNGACTGFLFAMNTAQAYMAQGVYRTALVIGAECLSKLTDWSDRSTCILFGDGAGAAVLRADPEGRFIQVTHSAGDRGGALTCSSRIGGDVGETPRDAFLRMDGGEVFKFAVSKVPEVIGELLQREQLLVEDIDYFVLHQANARIVRAVAKRLGGNPDRFPMNISEYGNTSSASIPILLDELNRAGRLKNGMRLVMAGFGGGLSYGASLIVL
ncbi:MAG: ketoacyl-ACP synthase III [Clostridium sp.]|nr:ketoacyl-ACP synthase III [Acetatifactor muris]MCM1528085.1 ketoacyl-ACP synthase III [Bacteroides sp.]MCM1562132.1 ketoacyl-ACP synthase III [Clostridium sp.]